MARSTMGVKLDEETRARLKKLGELRNRSPHWLMKEAIRRYLDVEEHHEREKAEDEARWERYLMTGTAIPHREAKTRLDELAEQARRRARRG